MLSLQWLTLSRSYKYQQTASGEPAGEAPAITHFTLHKSLPKLPKSDGSRVINSVEGLEVLSYQPEEE